MAKIDVPKWTIRLAEPRDEAFVYDSWLKTSARTYPNMHAADFATFERARVQRLLQSSISAVAQVEGLPDELLGHMVYAMWRGMIVVHFAFTKPDARRNGVFASLLSFADFDGSKRRVVLTSPAQEEKTMAALARKWVFEPHVVALMQRGDR